MNPKITISATFLFLILTQATASEDGNDAKIIFEMTGSDSVSYTKDILQISTDGSLELETVSPLDFKYEQNIIGKFRGKTEAKAYIRLSNALKEFASAPGKKEEPVHHGIWAELSIKSKSEERSHGWNLYYSELSKKVEDEYFKLKILAQKEIQSGLKLDCSSKEKNIACKIKSVGIEPVKTINPTGTFNTIFCVQEGRRKVLNQNNQKLDPTMMSPERLVLKSEEKIEFELKNVSCKDGHILIKTSDMIIHPNYKNELLGTLISQKIK